MADWLTDFVEYGSYGEGSPRLMFWVGVSTIAACLQRKVWFDQLSFQWSPNFYVLIVGPPGTVKKSTSIDLGMRLLKGIETVKMGPSIVTWQALIQYIAQNKQEYALPGGELFETSSVTLAISEFGSFFDPLNRDLVDNMTDLWDGKLGTISKMTKTSGEDSMVNPWINLIAATTPKWMTANFGEALVGGGLAGRFVFLYGETPAKSVAYPKRNMPKGGGTKALEKKLRGGLEKFARLGGEMELTEEAYEWGEKWYEQQQLELRDLDTSSLEAGFIVRKQVHLHKLAMVISVSRGKFPVVGLDEMVEAEARLRDLDGDMQKVFSFVGQTRLTSASQEIVDILTKHGPTPAGSIYKKYFFRKLEHPEYMTALNGALKSGMVVGENGNLKATGRTE